MAKYIKDLNKYLTDKSGLDAVERQQWRDKIAELSAKGNKHEAWKVFQSFQYWKETYQTPQNGTNKS